MRRTARRRSVWFWLFIAVVLILLLGLLFGGYRKGSRIDSGSVAPVITQLADPRSL
ncbi:MAG TPA: hypothetical protein VHV74_09085 [Pseudonocardiaceae bacterium]|jgi:hypothetical protein|nr:hypothetical protein [Pseudonocardiaceae bacterium]